MAEFTPLLPAPGPEVPGRVSIVCPTTDERAVFHMQLYACFCHQGWPDKQLVVIDTGSYPSPFLQQKAVEDRRVLYLHFCWDGASVPVGTKRNWAVQVASGEVIVHFDDDDLYAPCYVAAMVSGLTPHFDAATLCNWRVCDVSTGVVGLVDPRHDGSEEKWVLGYGFSYVYRRRSALTNPFSDAHFGEDYQFLRGLYRESEDGQDAVHILRDELGIVLHLQQGMNLSTCHAVHSLSCEDVLEMLVWNTPGTTGLLEYILQRQDQVGKPESPFISFGNAYNMYLRPPPHFTEKQMRAALRTLGVVAVPLAGVADTDCSALRDDFALCQEAAAWISYKISRFGECFYEPGRGFEDAVRYRENVILPQDVDRTMLAEHLALLHLLRRLLRRCPPQAAAAVHFEGTVVMRVRRLYHVSFIALLCQMTCYFPRINFTVHFDGVPALVEEHLTELQRTTLPLLLAKSERMGLLNEDLSAADLGPSDTSGRASKIVYT
eukprot:TRINITY_DN54479_c0_g1_i1.p1 TRINITY_DN54479_c0_g1~~TRINITY_DN54479_c0_g1_i1.p1  ORF type:complete len:513 (+),score=46.77 TRINITY_DN54479_c0_g1_i1:68-1540(+)